MMAQYKLRKVVREETGPGVRVKSVTIRYDVLECGHRVRYRDLRTTGEQIHALFNGKRRRCYECCKQEVKGE